MTRRASVTLGDTTVTADDALLLERPNWLNDQLLSLWCEHVRPRNNEKLLILPPNITYFLGLCNDPADVVGELNLRERDVIVAAVNNTSNDGRFFMGPQGTHWSVLTYTRSSKLFVALDSSDNYNVEAAWRLARKLKSPLGLDDNEIVLKTARCTKQPNSYSCGDFTCAFIAKVVEDFVQSNISPTPDGAYATEQVKNRATGMRGELTALIELLAAGRNIVTT